MNNILIVDDNEKLRDDLCDWLTGDGFMVSSTTDGVSGMDLFLDKLPDLVIAEIDLARLNGFEFLAKIREISGGLPPIFIFLTARSRMIDMRRGMSYGADDYLFKPVSKADLLSAVKTRLAIRHRLIQGVTFNANIQSSLNVPFNLHQVDVILKKLSKTEIKILKVVSEEMSTAEIARLLYVSPKTVENHRHNISRKLHLKGGHSVMSLAFKLRPILASLGKL